MPLSVIDLFAGAGGLSDGFLQTNGYEIKVAVEINEAARKTYKRNHGGVTLLQDVTNLDYNYIRERFGSIDVVIGGPPCQGFSNANRHKSELISGNNQLVKQYIKAIEQLKPRALVMENVKMMSSEKHKFFLSNLDYEELNRLNNILDREDRISINNDVFFIGDSSVLDSVIVQNAKLEEIRKGLYLINANFNRFLLRSVLFTKLKSIQKKLNKPSEAIEIIFKNKELFEVNQETWLKSISEYLSNLHEDIFVNLHEEILYTLESRKINDCFKHILDTIINTQAVLLKLDELEKYGILLRDIGYNSKGINVTLETYNVFKYIIGKLKSLGYIINSGILKASQFGVPQDRERLIIMGVREDQIENQSLELPRPIITSSCDYFTIADAIRDIENLEPCIDISSDFYLKSNADLVGNPLSKYLNDDTFKLYNHVITNTREVAKKRFEQLQPGQNFHDLQDEFKTTYTDPKRTQSTIYKRLDYTKPADTVTNVRKSMWIHPNKDRAVSIREAARLQSFRDSFIFEGNKDQQYQQVGNAVPPLLARAVAEQLLKILGEPIDITLRDILSNANKKNLVEEIDPS